MVLTVDQLREIPIRDSDLRIKRVIVDYKKIVAVAFSLSKSGFFSRATTLPFSAIRNVEPKAVTLADQTTATSVDQEFADPERFGDLSEREVFTERKRYLGRLVTYKIDTDTGHVTAIWVKPPLVLRDLWRQILLISRSQIVSVTPQAIIVDEAVIKAALKPTTVAELNREPDAALGPASVAEQTLSE